MAKRTRRTKSRSKPLCPLNADDTSTSETITRKDKGSYGTILRSKAKQQRDFKVRDLVILNAKNIRTKRPSKKLAPKLYGPFKILEQRGELAYKLEISDRWKIHSVFHVSLLEPYRTSTRPGREQQPMTPEEIDGDREWEVEKIVKSEIISYKPRVRGSTRSFEKQRYFVKWKWCSEYENT